MAAALGMCFVFKIVVSSDRSNNTLIIFKMETESFKEYSEAALVEKEEIEVIFIEHYVLFLHITITNYRTKFSFIRE